MTVFDRFGRWLEDHATWAIIAFIAVVLAGVVFAGEWGPLP